MDEVRMFDVLSRMIRTGILTESPPTALEEIPVVETLQKHLLKVLGRALCIRQMFQIGRAHV